MKRIKSFTIIELVVVFVITSVLIAICAGVIITIFKSMEINFSVSNAKTESINLISSLEKDLENNLLDFEYNNNKIRIKNNNGSIDYVFSNKVITRFHHNQKTELEFHLESSEFLVAPTSRSLRIDFWSKSIPDTFNIYYNFSNRYFCLKTGYLN